MNREDLLKQVSLKTQISKENILSLASSLQSIDCKNDQEIKSFILNISKLTNKTIDEKTMNKLISIIKNKKIPEDISKML